MMPLVKLHFIGTYPIVYSYITNIYIYIYTYLVVLFYVIKNITNMLNK